MSHYRFSIGSYRFGAGASLAPMAGVTNPPFRQLCSQMGAIFCVTELISCHAVLYSFEKTRNLQKKRGIKTRFTMDCYRNETPHIVQLYGRDPDYMARAARIVESHGAHIIDLNFGCPARKVIKNGMGCGVALMRQPDLLEEIAAEVTAAVTIPVTAKTRIGYERDQLNGVDVARRLERAGVKLITVHGRTREQGHSGPVNYDYIKEIVDSVSIPVIGNGGIRTTHDADIMRARTGCVAVAVGQGCKGNPWIFRELAAGSTQASVPITLKDRLDTCRRHLNMFVQWGGEERAVLEMRKHAAWYLKGFDGAAVIRRRLGEAVSHDAFLSLLDEVPLGTKGT